jgi:hypothetical protein
MSIHILLQIEVHELKDEHQFSLGVDDIVQSDDVGVFEFFHEADLSDRS